MCCLAATTISTLSSYTIVISSTDSSINLIFREVRFRGRSLDFTVSWMLRCWLRELTWNPCEFAWYETMAVSKIKQQRKDTPVLEWDSKEEFGRVTWARRMHKMGHWSMPCYLIVSNCRKLASGGRELVWSSPCFWRQICLYFAYKGVFLLSKPGFCDLEEETSLTYVKPCEKLKSEKGSIGIFISGRVLSEAWLHTSFAHHIDLAHEIVEREA